MKRITLTDYPSPHYPVKASWQSGFGHPYAVFATRKEAEDFFIGCFGKIEIIDKRKEEAE